MTGSEISQGMSKPPEGVLAGESVPTENESHTIDRAKIERVANTLKAIPKYHRKTQKERERAAERIIRKQEQ